MRTLLLTGVLCVAVTARAQAPEPVTCKLISVQVTQKLTAAAMAEVPATNDEKRVLGEFQRGVAEECVKEDGDKCYVRTAGELTATPSCKGDRARAWMMTSASQIIPTQTRQNRATQLLQGVMGVPVTPAPVAASPAPAPSRPPPPGAAPPGPPPPPPSVAAAPTVPPPPPSSSDAALPVPPPPPSILPGNGNQAAPGPVATAQPTPPPPPPEQQDAPVARNKADKEKEEDDDAPVIEGEALLTRSLVNLSNRDLRVTQKLLEDQKPGFGLSIGMYAGGLAATVLGSYVLINSVGPFGSDFGVVVGGVALAAGIAMLAIGTISLIFRLKARDRYNAKLDEVRALLQHRPRKARSSIDESSMPGMVTLAQW